MIGSPQQLGAVLFEKLGLSRKRRGKTGFSTDARVLQAIRDEHEIIPKIERWRELNQIQKTYLDVLPQLADAESRIHTTFVQAVATTGRLASTNPNMQNVPVRTELGREIRGCFEAAPGNVLISADYSQVELRVLAHIADEPVLEEIFVRGEDVHTATAAQVFGKDPSELTPMDRSKSKMINYGIVYGLSDYGLADRLNIPREEAKAFIDAYLERFGRVAEFMKQTIVEATEHGHVTTLFGRRRQIPELRARNWQVRTLGERLAVNTVIQGTAADVMKLAMIRVHDELQRRGLGTRMILTIHDELLLEGPPGRGRRGPRAGRARDGRPVGRPRAAAGRRRRRRPELAGGEVAASVLLRCDREGEVARLWLDEQAVVRDRFVFTDAEHREAWGITLGWDDDRHLVLVEFGWPERQVPPRLLSDGAGARATYDPRGRRRLCLPGGGSGRTGWRRRCPSSATSGAVNLDFAARPADGWSASECRGRRTLAPAALLADAELLGPWPCGRAKAAAARRRDRAAARHPAGQRELGWGDAQVVAEGPVDEALGVHQAQGRGHQRRRVHARDEALHAQQPAEWGEVLVAERAVALERLPRGPGGRRRRRAARARRPARSTARCGCPRPWSAGSGRRVADEEHAVLDRAAHLVGDPVALVADGVDVEVRGQAHGRLLDVVARVERADADAQLVAGREAPRVARAHVGGVEPQLEVVAGAMRVDLQAA